MGFRRPRLGVRSYLLGQILGPETQRPPANDYRDRPDWAAKLDDRYPIVSRKKRAVSAGWISSQQEWYAGENHSGNQPSRSCGKRQNALGKSAPRAIGSRKDRR